MEATMAREHWRDTRDERPRPREDFGQADYSRDWAYDPRSRTGYRAEEAYRRDDDYGQADYARDYDAARGRPYQRFSGEDRSFGHPDDRGDGRSWMDRAGDFLAGRPRHADYRSDEPARDYDDRDHRRRGPSDRVLWAVIMERLDEQRRLDLRDVKVTVRDGEVILDGAVRRREDKRRIEDVVDVDGVRNVQNNLRPRDVDRRWRLL
jgi:hypothetical protein